jgi:hypothetical protein
MYRASFRDREGRTVVIMKPTKEARLAFFHSAPLKIFGLFSFVIILKLITVLKFQNTTSHEGQIRFLVYVLENAILNLPENKERMIWLIDFTGWTMAHATPMKTARESTSILQNHYPERLAIAFLFNPPKIFETFYKVKAVNPQLYRSFVCICLYSQRLKTKLTLNILLDFNIINLWILFRLSRFSLIRNLLRR